MIQADEVAGIDFAQHAPLPEQIVVPECAAPLDDQEHGMLMANFDPETVTNVQRWRHISALSQAHVSGLFVKHLVCTAAES